MEKFSSRLLPIVQTVSRAEAGDWDVIGKEEGGRR